MFSEATRTIGFSGIFQRQNIVSSILFPTWFSFKSNAPKFKFLFDLKENQFQEENPFQTFIETIFNVN